MYYFLYPTKDSFVSSDPNYVFKNMGIDEILEVEKRVTPLRTYSTSSAGAAFPQSEVSFGSKNTILSRAILHFDLITVSQSIAAGNISNARFYLSLKTAEAKQIPLSYTLAAYPLAKDWNMGTGHKFDGSPTSNGVSWKYSDGISLKWWASQSLADSTGGGIWYVSSSLLGSGSGYAEPPFVSPTPYDPFPYCSGSAPSTGSSPIPPVTGGFACSQSFSYESSDVYMDVTTIMNAWLSNTIPNYGLIVLHSGESDNVDYGKLRFFSKETNTIYSPKIDVCWDSSSYATGSGTGSIDEISISDSVVSIKNMSEKYKHGSIVRFQVTPRKRYPVKTFTNRLSDYLEPYSLPRESYYSIRDAESEEDVIPYSFGTKLSLSPELGNYFYLDTTGLPQERYFSISIRTEQSGSINTFVVPNTFKISR